LRTNAKCSNGEAIRSDVVAQRNRREERAARPRARLDPRDRNVDLARE
jgi:hypothetical protein